MKKPVKYSIFIVAGVILAVLILEAASIEKWSSLAGPGESRIGVIEYRSGFGELNRITMTINELGLGLLGYRFSGPSSRGHFDRWMHTYVR